MNYQKIYNQIIERAKNRVLEEYKEKHHIIPKCMGGNNDEENIAELTAREHFIVHKLLVEIYPNKNLKWALYHMCNFKKYKVNNREYERLRREFALMMKGRTVSPETREKIGEKHKCKITSEETKSKMRRPRSDDTKIKMRKPKTTTINMKGKKSDSHINNMKKPKPPNFGKEQSIRLKGKKKSLRSEEHKNNLSKSILQYDLEGNFIREWPSMKIAGDKLNIFSSGIGACCRGIRITAGKYKWSFKLLNQNN